MARRSDVAPCYILPRYEQRTETLFRAEISTILSGCDGKTLVTSKIYLHQAAFKL